MARRSQRRRQAAAEQENHRRLWLLAAVTSLWVARPLVAGDGGALAGHGYAFTLLWLAVAVLWFLSRIKAGGLAIRFVWADAAILALVLVSIASGLWAVKVGHPRPAINMSWEWLAMGVAYFLLRQLLATQAECRGLVVAMLGVAVGQAGLGYYQTAVAIPEARARYEQIQDDPLQLMRETGHWSSPESAARRRFESRLYSPEPNARFALANSLAGFLVPWLVLGLGIAVLQMGSDRAALYRAGGTALLMLFLAGCLLLTRSRTAILAGVVGVFALACLSRPCWTTLRGSTVSTGGVEQRVGRSKRLKRIGVTAGVIIVLLVAVAFTGRLGRETLSAAGRSLLFRVQYWQATVRMILDYPLTGCGLGQFQETYTAYKLPQASEEVQDPHNFLLEVWAKSGTLALAALLLVLVEFGRWMGQAVGRAHSPAEPDAAAAVRAFRFIGGGALAGSLLGFAVSSVTPLPMSVVALVVLVVAQVVAAFVFHSWILAGALPPRLTAVGVGVVLVNLSAAGALSFPGVAGTLWLLIAVGLTLTDGPQKTRMYSAPLAVLGAAGCGLAALVCYLTFCWPVMQRENLTLRALAAGQQGDSRLAEKLLLAAAEADPYSALAARRLAEYRFAQWKNSPAPSLLSRWEESVQRMLALSPRSDAAWRMAGVWYRQVYAGTGLPEHLQSAVEKLQRAVRLYPNQAISRADLAVTLRESGREDEARRQAELALELDEITARAGHEDRLLPRELRERLLRITAQVPAK